MFCNSILTLIINDYLLKRMCIFGHRLDQTPLKFLFVLFYFLHELSSFHLLSIQVSYAAYTGPACSALYVGLFMCTYVRVSMYRELETRKEPMRDGLTVHCRLEFM